MEEKGYFSLQCSGHTLSPRDVRAGAEDGNLEQELKWRPRRVAPYWLAPHGLLILIFYFIFKHF